MLDYILDLAPFLAILAGAGLCIWAICAAAAGEWDAYEPGVWDDNVRDGRDWDAQDAAYDVDRKWYGVDDSD